MQIATHSNGLGIYVNEMQRSINGLGHYQYPHAQAGGYYDTNIIPYSYWRPYSPHDARGDNCGMLGGGVGCQRTNLGRRSLGRRSLGDVPNDFEASVDLQYIPVRQGWYYGKPVDGRGYPDVRGGFGQAAAAAAASGNDEALKQLAKAEKIQTILQVISTLSIATIASLAIGRAIRNAKNGHVRPFFGDDEDED